MFDRRSFAGLLIALSLAACSPAPDATVADPSSDALMARIDAGDAPLILDVRTAAEYAAGHIPGAVNIPHTEIAARMAELGDSDREIVIHCKSGRRASIAGQQLAEAGYTRVVSLEGHMDGWEANGLPVVTEPAP